jgi:hypothetical protein
MKNLIVFLLTSALSITAFALEPLQKKKGFSGFANLGVGGGQVESNFFAKIDGVDIDLGDDTINDLGAPGSKDVVLPALAFELGYTFANGKTRVFLGNDFADYLQFDRSTRFGIRHDFDGLGTMQIAYLNAAALSTEVWSDPYLVGVARDSTKVEVSGARFTWDNILGTKFELKVSATERDLDDERSGESQPLTAEERNLLDRNGDVYRAELGYLYKISDKHILRPSIRYVDEDLDGRAMASSGVAIDLSYVYSTPKGTRWVNNATYGEFDGDKDNPLFDKRNDADRYFFSSTLFLRGFFGLENWTPNIGAVWGKLDTDINFNQSNMWLVNVGVLRRF